MIKKLQRPSASVGLKIQNLSFIFEYYFFIISGDMVNWYPNSSLLGVNIPSYNGLPLQMGAKLPDWNRSLGGLPFQINHLQGNL